MTTAVAHRGRLFRVLPQFEFGDDEDRLLEEYWDPQPRTVVFDVGARCGRYALPALMAGAEVYAIDPNPVQLKGLQLNATLNGVEGRLTTVQVALGDGGPPPTDEIEMLEHFDWTLSPRGANWSTFDRLVDRFQPDRLDLVKIDVDGQELQVLHGAERSLRRFHPTLWIEDHSMVFAELGAAFHARLTGWLHGAGYAVEVVPYYDGDPPREYLLARGPEG